METRALYYVAIQVALKYLYKASDCKKFLINKEIKSTGSVAVILTLDAVLNKGGIFLGKDQAKCFRHKKSRFAAAFFYHYFKIYL